ncbi:tail length tape measure protein [Rhizobium phage RHEph22]|uniref:Tape measure protein n=1 Tax=Rhizobium phage RHEph22 TaxID=2836135 RepID=A0AAE8B521_9CAUD|nr:tail length tape measure protein [Rhizobium phage RHEph22]QXV74754.1 putative tape measure protein [Rhizobium phage RHEph22]QXV74848.1 putative tape measure protein [Rhizobium phage RHEph24]
MEGTPVATDMFQMSDEDFLKMTAPPIVEAPAVVEEPKVEDAPVVEQPTLEEPKQEETNPLEKPDEEITPENKDVTPEGERKDGGEQAKPAEAKTDEAKPEDKTDGEKKDTPSAEVQPTPINYEEGYKKILAPFKANGKEIKLNSPEEAIKLMQMGANYTRKMQELAPKMKLVTMLDNNKLTESDISFFIDLKNKDPEAIKKLIKDSGVDPLDINTAEPSSYQPGNHSVSDQQVAFQSKLDEYSSTDDGRTTLLEINNTWDQTSKDALWNQPELIDVFHQQRANGVYDQITTEMERQRTLGIIPRNIPFIEAYHRAGKYLVENKQIVVPGAEKPTPVVQDRVVTPKTDPNADRVKAAAPAKDTPAKKQEAINYLAMDDEAFLKQMQGRL